MKPVAAAALFAGFLFKNRTYSLLIVGLSMFISDSFLGSYPLPIAIAVYSGLLFPVFAGRLLANHVNKPGCNPPGIKRSENSPGYQNCQWVRAYSSWIRIALVWLGSIIFCSLFFFLVSNFACWLFGGWYERSLFGLLECFLMALPFLKLTLIGDLIFASCLFVPLVVVKVVASFAGGRKRIACIQADNDLS
ncbi:MAG TPA: hypothetical protein PKD64_18015 [Pirellulaceae bacterium]|nr:hypothetical protein [Pirellulaceae bacterium]HMO94085.1 hypothetical protein [Pirellulaceae bacterium]HMP71158.1 hypothetical protein [Pirellulaceae bacterium]